MVWHLTGIFFLIIISLGVTIRGWLRRLFGFANASVGGEDQAIDAPHNNFEDHQTRAKWKPDPGPGERTGLLRGSASSSVTAVSSSNVNTPKVVNSRQAAKVWFLYSKLCCLSDSISEARMSGIFQNASNFLVNNSVFVKYDQLGAKETVLRWIAEYIIVGAEFDSSAREPPPRCHPGTRLRILESILGWLMNRGRKQRLLWLNGPAGVGKSAIVQSAAETAFSYGILGATLFFSRINNRNNPSLVFTTIAYQLAVRIPAYRRYLRSQMVRDPLMLDKGMKKLFRLLFVEPLENH
ncbi:hypothetical protein NP233_g11042 [Leucocoprinus birnbaumii]|uniref:Nephrocystin 3-like N-terminal domain-containing protein n=1 Tax=Leucocoprinus birnbaumii TaxID=56174 RepID=A0AAD5VHS6_9AGAR|nr:hypothetical protein NP233_g11042 [Leucocoprinus birnbaumii]